MKLRKSINLCNRIISKQLKMSMIKEKYISREERQKIIDDGY